MRQLPEGGNTPHLRLLLFCGGVISLRFFDALPPWPAALFCAAALLIASMRMRKLLPLALFAIGFCWAAVTAAQVLSAALPRALEKKDVVISGRVIGVPVVRGETQRFDFQVAHLEWRGKSYPPPRKVRLRMFDLQPHIVSGQRWRFTARLKRAHARQNPGAQFNYETYLFHHRLRATGYVRASPPPKLLSPPPSLMPSAFRQRVAGFIHETLGEESRAGLVTALSVGIRGGMRARDWEVLTRTGTIHLVAISGLHIGMVSTLALLLAGGVWRFAGNGPLHLPAQKFGILFALLAGLIYAVLADFTIPTRRAACMLTVVACAVFFQRRPFSRETLILALTTVLALDPLAPLSAGFWLSFGAVAVLLMSAAHLHPPPLHAQTKTARAAKHAVTTVRMWSAAQIVLFIGMAPLTLALFHRISLSAPFANLIAIPAVGLFVVPAALCGLLFYALGFESAAAVAFAASNFALEQLWVALEMFAKPEWSVWRRPPPPWWALPPAAIGAALLLAPRALPARAAGLLWLLPLFFHAHNAPARGEFRYTALDAGNGLASVVQTENHFLVYDAGASLPGVYDIGETVVAPFLRMHGAKSIDVLLISHGDNDHSGGRGALQMQFPTGKIVTGAPQLMPDAIPCAAGQTWVRDEVEFAILWPPPNTARSGNDASCVLKVTSRFGALLLSGDIGVASESVLASSRANIAADVLLAPHHGSKTSSSARFLQRVNPRIAIASAGYLNAYGHPHRSVRARYARFDIPLYTTADEGALSLAFENGGIVLHGRRAAAHGYWIHPARKLQSPLRIQPRAQKVTARNPHTR